MNDEEAVRRCQDGDREAFRHLVERYKDVLYGTACLMTGNASVAEEHVQESFLLAWRGVGGFRVGLRRTRLAVWRYVRLILPQVYRVNDVSES